MCHGILLYAGYLQVHGHSLENQLFAMEESIASGAPREVHNVCGSVYHGVPPAMTEIFEAARSGDTILVYRVDRLGRNMKVFVPWLDKLSGRGVNVRSVWPLLGQHLEALRQLSEEYDDRLRWRKSYHTCS
jgi:DNA invertase Pin-like site-specific DNA recombinase